MSITERLFTGGNVTGAAVGSVTMTSNGKHHALCACFDEGRSICCTIVRSRLRHLSSGLSRMTGYGVHPRSGVVRLVCARLDVVGRAIMHGNGLHTRFFHGV